MLRFSVSSRRRASALVLAMMSTLSSMVASSRVAHADDSDASDEAPKTAKQKEAEVHYKRARELYQLGRYREAIAQLEAALRLDPKGAELAYNLALVHEKMGDADEAISAYKRYLGLLGPDADPEERKKTEITIRRLSGAKDELAARERAQMGTEHRFTPLSATLLVTAGVGVVATGVLGYIALHDDRNAQHLVVGTGGTYSDREALATRAKHEAVATDIVGGVTAFAGISAVVLYFASEYARGGEGGPAKPTCDCAATSFGITPLARGGGAVEFQLRF